MHFLRHEFVTTVNITRIRETAISSNTSVTKEVANPTQHSKWAYVTLISGINPELRYRGFLYNAIIMRRSLLDLGSQADFIALLGFDTLERTFFTEDLYLLRSYGIITCELARLLDPSIALSFAEMALLKVAPYSFTQYERVQFFDGDVLPVRNMDCFFSLKSNAFTKGAVSPLNSGWFLALPDPAAYAFFKERALWRLGRDWDINKGWGLAVPTDWSFRGGQACTQWSFNGADMDQGLFAHYFLLLRGGALVLDTELQTALFYPEPSPAQRASGDPRPLPRPVALGEGLASCAGNAPTRYFVHFTGRSKPWMRPKHSILPSSSTGRSAARWMRLLDSLQLAAINSSSVLQLGLDSPLGFFNANFPKGGYPVKAKAASRDAQQ
jgi:hypothetical protein